MTDIWTLRRNACAAAIDELAEREGGAPYRARLASIEPLRDRLNAVYERHDARVETIADLDERTNAECDWIDSLTDFDIALDKAARLPARVAAALADDPDRELPPERPKPPKRPSRPKAQLLRVRY
jgi:hypothetical protein